MCITLAPFTMTSFVVILVTTIIWVHNTIKGVLIRLRIKNPNFWYSVIATIIFLLVFFTLCIRWDIISINLISFCAGEIDPGPKCTWTQFF